MLKKCKRCLGLGCYAIWDFGLSKNGTFNSAKKNLETTQYDNGRLISMPCRKCSPLRKAEILYVGPDYETVAPPMKDNESLRTVIG